MDPVLYNEKRSMELASPRQSKLLLLSVAQSNPNFNDAFQSERQLELDNKITEEDNNNSSNEPISSSMPLSKIQSEIQLMVYNNSNNMATQLNNYQAEGIKNAKNIDEMVNE